MFVGVVFILWYHILSVNANSVSEGDCAWEDNITVSSGDTADGDTASDDGALDEVLLLLPARVDFVIDPWEIEGCGQIHSSNFMVQNVSECSGWLNISGITLMAGEESEVFIWTVPEGIRDDSGKNIYMEMNCSSGDILVLSEEEQEYRVFLAPGDVFEFEFSGAVNQHSAMRWEEKDVSIRMMYSWDIESESSFE